MIALDCINVFAQLGHGRGIENIRAGFGAIERQNTNAIVTDFALNNGARSNGGHSIHIGLFPANSKRGTIALARLECYKTRARTRGPHGRQTFST